MAMNTHQVAKAAGAASGASNENKDQQKAKSKSATDKVMDAFSEHANKLAMQLGGAMDPKKFLATCVNGIARDPNLIRCMVESPRSVFGGVYLAASLGFEPNTPLGLCYILPRHAKDKVASEKEGRDIYRWQANFQLGYQGTVTLLYRSGEVSYISAEEVFEKDHFKYQLGTNPFIEHIPYDGPNPGKVVKYYAVVKLKNGGSLFKVWSTDKVMDHAKKFSSSYNAYQKRFFGPWENNFSSMAKKSVLLDCMKYAPKSTQLALNLATDNVVKSIPLDNSTSINMLQAPNEAFELEMKEPESGEGANAAGESDVFEPTNETPEQLKERLGLMTGSQVKPPVGQMSVEDVI